MSDLLNVSDKFECIDDDTTFEYNDGGEEKEIWSEFVLNSTEIC